MYVKEPEYAGACLRRAVYSWLSRVGKIRYLNQWVDVRHPFGRQGQANSGPYARLETSHYAP
eukprot:scaffold95797_cov28-Tisochrysis_lutea.AAC.8